ncbi:hypothetical protein MLD38_007422 [Melastoma candidum]|uniref:Uncharacterized protein n=1 Tax=Melastoma candidum TaxID=119954 RepID=A0ACB9RQQ3_9MYRT|nr:hypothetical protein MLD38_007422 [Melastoma candidum]
MQEAFLVLARRNCFQVSTCCYRNEGQLLKSRDTSVDQGLDYVASWNAGILMSSDLKEAVATHLKKRKPIFAKL